MIGQHFDPANVVPVRVPPLAISCIDFLLNIYPSSLTELIVYYLQFMRNHLFMQSLINPYYRKITGWILIFIFLFKKKYIKLYVS